jgi:Skp family chaperone for outer membrane proteins
MTRVILNARQVLVALTAIMALSMPALAQQVIVFDPARVMAETTAGKDVAAKLTAIETQMSSELRPEAEALAAEEKALQDATRALVTPEMQGNPQLLQQALAARPDLRQRAQSFEQRASAFNQKRQRAAQEFQLTEQAAWRSFFDTISPIMDEITAARGASVVMERQAVTMVKPAADVTGDLISRVNQRVQTIDVTRQRLPAQ